MKTLLKSLAVLAATATFAFSADAEWMTDFDAAKAKAKAEKKVLLLNFTGSDWCGWCHKLDNEVFSQKEFTDYAAANLVLVTVDFPKTKKLEPALTKQNEKLGEKYKVEGYPTIELLKPSGAEIAKTGYQEGGAAKYVEHLKGLIK
jgi:thioredoxin-related protein